MKAPYGSWQSPITSDLIVAGSIGLGGPRYDGDDFYWQEGRPQEGGRICIVRRSADGKIEDVTPPPFNARTRVHEYGGASWTVIDGVVYFTNFADQDIYRIEKGQEPVRLTEEPTLRFANAIADRSRNRLICIVESHGEGESEPENYLGAVDLASGDVEMLASGHDFFSSPALSPDGSSLAWMTWDHPDMPWDSTQIWLADLDTEGQPANVEAVAGGENIAAQQPRFSPSGELWFVSDASGWWNLWRLKDNRAEQMCEMEAEFGQPHWMFGLSTFVFEDSGDIICVYSIDNESHLGRMKASSGELQVIAQPFETIPGLAIGNGRCCFVGASATSFSSIVELDLESGESTIARQSSDITIDSGYLSVP